MHENIYIYIYRLDLSLTTEHLRSSRKKKERKTEVTEMALMSAKY